MDGDNRLRVCHSACESYNTACGARLDCSDRTLFSGEEGDGEGTCTGDGAVRPWWHLQHASLAIIGFLLFVIFCLLATLRHAWCLAPFLSWYSSWGSRDAWGFPEAVRDDIHGPYVVLTEADVEGSNWSSGNKRPAEIFEDPALWPLATAFNVPKPGRIPSRHSPIEKIHLDRTGQLSSRGSPRKGDYAALDASNVRPIVS